MSLVIVNEQELRMYKDMKNHSFLPDEVALLIDYRKLFIKVIDAKIADIRMWLYNLEEDPTAKLKITILQELKKSMDWTIEAYTKYLEENKE